MGPCQRQQNWPFLPFPADDGWGGHEEQQETKWQAGPHGMALDPAPWRQDIQQVLGMEQ